MKLLPIVAAACLSVLLAGCIESDLINSDTVSSEAVVGLPTDAATRLTMYDVEAGQWTDSLVVVPFSSAEGRFVYHLSDDWEIDFADAKDELEGGGALWGTLIAADLGDGNYFARVYYGEDDVAQVGILLSYEGKQLVFSPNAFGPNMAEDMLKAFPEESKSEPASQQNKVLTFSETGGLVQINLETIDQARTVAEAIRERYPTFTSEEAFNGFGMVFAPVHDAQ